MNNLIKVEISPRRGRPSSVYFRFKFQIGFARRACKFGTRSVARWRSGPINSPVLRLLCAFNSLSSVMRLRRLKSFQISRPSTNSSPRSEPLKTRIASHPTRAFSPKFPTFWEKSSELKSLKLWASRGRETRLTYEEEKDSITCYSRVIDIRQVEWDT